MKEEKLKKRLTLWYLVMWLLLIAAIYLAYGVYFVDLTSTKSKWIVLFSSAICILLCGCKFLEISHHQHYDENIKNYIKQTDFLGLTYSVIRDIGLILFLTVLFLISIKHIALLPLICFIFGLALFIFTSKIASYVLLTGKIKAQNSQSNQLNTSLKMNFNSSSAAACLFWGMLCSGIVVLFHIFKDYELLVVYALGFCTGSFFRNSVSLISKKVFENTEKIITKYKNQFGEDSSIKDILNIVSVKNPSVFFEIFAIVLISSILIGMNTIELMGGFFPLIVTTNAMFASIIVVLFSKNNKTNKLSKHFFKKAFFILFMVSIMSIAEIYFWLGADFIQIGYSASLGALAGFIVLYFNKERKTDNDFKIIKNNCSKAIFHLIIAIILFFTVFILSDGMNYVYFAFYNITIAILGYSSINMLASIGNYDKTIEYSTQNYLKSLNILIPIVAIICYGITSQADDCDIFNPLITIALFMGILIPFISSYIASHGILSQTKKFALDLRKKAQKNLSAKKITIKSAIKSFMVPALIFLILSASMYITKTYLGLDVLVGYYVGLSISSIVLLYSKYDILKNISFLTIRLSTIMFMSMTILFV